MTTDQVFRCPVAAKLGIESWRVMLGGRVLPHDWNSRGAAQAGLETERRRLTLTTS